MEYRFDGLRFDAVHAITEKSWLFEVATRIRTTLEPGRRVHLVLENEHNEPELLESAFNAQWNDDGHNVLHVLLTGEHETYYANYAENAAEKLARCLQDGFVYQGEPMPTKDGEPRGRPSGHLPPTAFVLFLQNHDQIGNRAFGSRLTELTDPASLRAAVALQLLSPQIPLLFMGEEWGSREPFLFFTHHGEDLAAAVRHGRSQEFAALAHFSDPEKRLQIPDPNAFETFERSIPKLSDLEHAEHRAWLDYYRQLLLLRQAFIVPRLLDSSGDSAVALGSHGVRARWTLGDGAELTILLNLGSEAVGVEPPSGAPLFESLDGAGAAVIGGSLPPRSCCVWFAPDKVRA
jgi:maltooligosyltrehalose trehalohydrolase